MTGSSANASVYLVASLCLAAVFLYNGAIKPTQWRAAIAEFEDLGPPSPSVTVAATVAVQLVGALAAALGWRVRPAALALAASTVVATPIGHPFWNFEGPDFQRPLTTMLEHLAIVGGFLLLAAVGPDRLSLEHKERIS
jgi:putative oxidoreductase